MNIDIITIIWFIPACGLFLFGCYAGLERLSHKNYKDKSSPYFNQALFLFIAAIITLILDTYALQKLFSAIEVGEQVNNLSRFLLFPLVMYIGAKIHGGKKDEKITIETIRTRQRNRKKNQ